VLTGRHLCVQCLLREPLDRLTEETWLRAGLFDCEDGVGNPYLRYVKLSDRQGLELLSDPRIEGVAFTLIPPAFRPAEDEARLWAIACFGFDQQDADSFYAPAKKPFPGPGNYAVVFTAPPEEELANRWSSRGIKFLDAFGPRSFHLEIPSATAYQLLNCAQVDCVNPVALHAQPRPRDDQAWRTE
jgi:hypothetical protein